MGKEGSKNPCECCLRCSRMSGLKGEFFRKGSSLLAWAMEGLEKLLSEVELALELVDCKREGRENCEC